MERVRRFLVVFYTSLERDSRIRDLLALSTFRVEARPELASGMDAKRKTMQVWVKQLTELMEEAARRGELRGDIQPRLAALAVISQFNGVISTWIVEPELFSPAEHASSLADAALRGLAQMSTPPAPPAGEGSG